MSVNHFYHENTLEKSTFDTRFSIFASSHSLSSAFTNPERHYFCPSFLFSYGERRCRMAFLAAEETKLGTFLAELRKK
nr:MAG TPA: hypothetical protein [Caudoviricetes sp.]